LIPYLSNLRYNVRRLRPRSRAASIRRPPAAFRSEGSYAVAVIELDAGVKVTGRLEGSEDVKGLGTRVTLVGNVDGVSIFRAS